MQDPYEPFPELKTERLLLRRLMVEDAQNISRLRSNPEVNKYIQRDRACDVDGAKAFIKRIDEGIRNKTNIMWAICLIETGELVGGICLWNFSEDKKLAETGYDMFPIHHGKGYMFEALHALLGFVKEELKLDRVEAYTQKDNLASLRLLEKSGFHLEPERKDPDVPLNLIFSKNLEASSEK